MTIFDDLRASHEVQRTPARSMTHARATADKRRAAFLALATELDAHATAEEHGTFQLAGELLSKAEQKRLARGYRDEHANRGGRSTP